MKIYIILVSSIMLLFSSISPGQKKSEPFEFKFKGNTLRGLIESPTDKKPISLVIIVPGSGKTNFVEGNWYSDLRNYFISHQMACCFWDKAGCGKSEGEFKQLEHPIEESADEVVAAINKLSTLNFPGLEKIGLWGISRAGWVCPYVIQKYPPIAFWISVSSPDENDQSEYQLKTNLLIQGRNEKEVQILTEEYVKGEAIFVSGGSFEDYCQATKIMRTVPYCVNQAGKTDRDSYYYYQKLFLKVGYEVDHTTGKVFFLPGFREAISNINCPVLAIFGEKDSQVDWRKSRLYYQQYLGSNKKSDLAIKTFQNCNHNIQKCRTGAREEDLSEFGFVSCDGYYDSMTTWILNHKFGK